MVVEYPTPLFLARVDKKQGTVSVYHVMPRFFARAFGKRNRLVLQPEDREDGESHSWEGLAEAFSLSAPIIRATLHDLIDEERMNALRKVFQLWVAFDRDNCDLVRRGLLRFRMPYRWRVNEMPDGGVLEIGNAVPEPDELRRAILTLAEDAECVGGQLFRLNDRPGALRAALLVYHLWRSHKNIFENEPRWRGVIPGDLGGKVCDAVNKAIGLKEGGYRYQGFEDIGKALESDAAVKKLLIGEETKAQAM